MTKATMIALVGEQPLPNFLPVREFDYTHVLLVYTDTTKRQYGYLREKLEIYTTVYSLKTEPYDLEITTDDLRTKLNELESMAPAPFIFNLTGGTKIMSLAAYQVVMERNASVFYLQSEEGESVIDYYGWQDHQLIHQNLVKVKKCISLQEMLEIHLGPEGRKDELWRTSTEAELLNDTQNEGRPFELAIGKALKEEGYDVALGIKGRRNQLDIDVAAVRQNQLGIIEAKLSGQSLDGLKQLSYALRYLRGTYIKPFIVTADAPSTGLKEMSEALDIHIIELPHYQRKSRLSPEDQYRSLSLPEEDKKILLTKIEEVMKAD